jgi:hypothetical protein
MAAYNVLVSTRAFDETPLSLEPLLGSTKPCEFERDFAPRYTAETRHIEQVTLIEGVRRPHQEQACNFSRCGLRIRLRNYQAQTGLPS